MASNGSLDDQSPGTLARLGHFGLRVRSEDTGHIVHLSSGETMHPQTDPNLEAMQLYVQGSKLLERVQQKIGGALVLWDVGLGAAHNAMAAVRAVLGDTTETGQTLEIVSFENDLDALRLAMQLPKHFPHLTHAAPGAVLQDGYWRSPCGRVEWRLFTGDFLTTMRDAPVPDIIFHDPFSRKANGGLWTYACFRAIYSQCATADTTLHTYSVATGVRAALLAAGFFVASRPGLGSGRQSTVALTPAAWQRSGHDGLDRRWLERWRRSSSRFPDDVAAHEEGAFVERILHHAQFAVPMSAVRP